MVNNNLREFVNEFPYEASDMAIIMDFITTHELEAEAIPLISKLCESKLRKLTRERDARQSYLCFLSTMAFEDCKTQQDLLGTIRFWALGDYDFTNNRSGLRESMLEAVKRFNLTLPDLMFCDDRILWEWLRREFPDIITDEVWKEKISKLGYNSCVANGW